MIVLNSSLGFCWRVDPAGLNLGGVVLPDDRLYCADGQTA
jgi:hypothetical protein